MLLYNWIMESLLPVFLPQAALEQIVLYVGRNADKSSATALTVGNLISIFLSMVIGFCCVFFLVWVPFRGILSLLRWKRWRGY